MTQPLHGVHAEAVGEQVFVSVGAGGLALVVTRAEWAAFLAAAKRGDYDLEPVLS